MQKRLTIVIVLLTLVFQGKAQNVDSLLEVISIEKSASAKVELWLQIAFAYHAQNNDLGYQHALQEILHYSIDSKNDTLVGSVYNFIGSYYEDKALFKSAIENHLKSLAIFEKLNFKAGICLSSESIAVVYKELKNTTETFKYLRNAEKYLTEKEIKETYLPRGVYANLSEAFLMTNQIDSALFYIQKAEIITKKEQDPFGYSRILLNYGHIYSKKGDIDLAEVYYKKGIIFSDSTHETINLIENLNGLSALLLKNNKSESAKQYGLQSFIENAKSSNKVGVLSLSITNLLRQAYFNLAQYDSAYYYANLSESYRDSIYNEQSLNAIQDMTFQQKISETEQEAQKQKDEEDRKHLLQYIIIGVGLVSFIIISLVISNTSIFHYKAVGFLSVVGLLLIFEFVNLLLHPVLDKLTHHSPILIFLILVCIASLLVPLHHKLEKWAKDKLVSKNKEIHLANAKKTIEKLSNTSKESTE